MMAIVIDHSDRAHGGLDIGNVLYPPIDALETRERPPDRGIVYAELRRHRTRSKRVQHVVRAWKVDGDLEGRPATACNPDPRLQPEPPDVDGAHVGRLAEAVCQDRPADALQNAAHVLIVQTQYRQSVERQVVQEPDEALLQSLEVAAMGRQMIVVDVGDDRDERLQMHE